MVEGGMKCVKYLLFAFNLIFFLAGLGLIIAGAVVQTKFASYFDFFGGSFSAAAILLIVVGVIIFIIGFFGCCGAYKENYCMTMTFAVLLALIFILEIAAGITAYVMRDQVRSIIKDKMVESKKNYNMSAGVTKAWNTVQHDFKCCGVENATTDWNGNIPDSCCKVDYQGCAANGKELYKSGCLFKMEEFAKSNIYIIGGVGIGLAFVQLFGVLMACCLARSIKKEYEVV